MMGQESIVARPEKKGKKKEREEALGGCRKTKDKINSTKYEVECGSYIAEQQKLGTCSFRSLDFSSIHEPICLFGDVPLLFLS